LQVIPAKNVSTQMLHGPIRGYRYSRRYVLPPMS